MNLDRRLLARVYQYPGLGMLIVSLGPISGLLILLQACYLSQIVEDVFLNGASVKDVSRLLGLLLVVFFLHSSAAWAGDYSSSILSRKIKSNLRLTLFQHVLQLGPAYTAGEKTGELTGVVVEGVESLEPYFSQYLPGLVMAILIPATILVFVFPIDLLTAIILLITAPLIPIFMLLIGNNAQTLTLKRWQTLMRLKAYFLDVLQGMTTLKTLGRSLSQVKIIEQAGEKYRRVTMEVLKVTFLSSLSLELIATLSTAVIAVQVAVRLFYGQLSFYEAFLLLVLAPEFYQPLRVLGSRFHAGMAGHSVAQQLFQIIEQPSREESWFSEDRKKGSQRIENARAGVSISSQFAEIRLENIYFGYEPGRSAVRGISMSLRRGEKIALVGPSGGGKSTIANLLLRFIQAENGEIWVDDRRVEDIRLEEWHKVVAWVPQRPYIFPGSLLDNLKLAKPSASLEEVKQAAKLARADEFIQALPQGYETPLGERGTGLSAGQVQRIAIARAFLRDAPLIILDEATASLDTESETLIQESLGCLLKNRASLIIAHRLNTIVQADTIFVFDAGKIVQKGTHTELLSQEGLYQRLINSIWDDREELTFPSLTMLERDPVRPPLITGQNDADVCMKPMEQVEPRKSSAITAPGLINWLVQWIAPYSAWVMASALIGFATIASSMGLMFTSTYIISAAALQPSIAALQVAIVGVRFFGLSRGVFRYLERTSSHQVTFRLLAALRVRFYQALEPLSPARLMRYRSGDLLARIVGDIETLESFYVRSISPPAIAMLVGLASFCFLAYFSPLLGAILIMGMLVVGAGLPLVAGMWSKESGGQEVLRLSELNAVIVESIQGLPELAAFGQTGDRIEQVSRRNIELDQTQAELATIHAFQSAACGFLSHFCVWVMMVMMIPLVNNGIIEGVYLASLVLASLASFEATLPLSHAARQLNSHLEAAGRLYELIDASPEVVDHAEPQQAPEHPTLGMLNLSFRYSSTLFDPTRNLEEYETPWVLRDISFSLQPGKRLGIVGSSGAGKSTLIYLLLRFCEYQDGEVYLDGLDLRSFSQESVRSIMSVVMQKPYLFSASLRENLLLGNPAATHEEIERATRQACIHEFIQSLPQGYETWVGEQGVRLSAGELQRIAIARAFLNPARIMILDEPTAHLDALTEHQVLTSIFDESNRRSILMVSHRLVAMNKFDEILVLHDGRIAQRGMHFDLLRTKGIYRRMWELQGEGLRR